MSTEDIGKNQPVDDDLPEGLDDEGEMLDDAPDECQMYHDGKRWTCPKQGTEWCDFPDLNCTGG